MAVEGPVESTGASTVVRLQKKEVVLVSRPQGMPSEESFQVCESDFVFTRPPPPGTVVLKVLWLSVDPYLREIMHQKNGLISKTPFQIGQPIVSTSISKVMASSNPEFEEGDFASAVTPVTNYVLLPQGSFGLKKIDPKGANIPLTHYLGVLGLPGHTAWVGLNVITQLHANDEVYISAAGGDIGLLAGQLAKLKGCRVVGSVGSDEKVRILKEVYNFDDAFNYKTEKDLDLALKRCFPNGFDVYFENVGGQTLEAALANVKRKGRIVVCGMVSQYNKKFEDRDGVRNLIYLIGKSLKMEGFLTGDHLHTGDDFFKEVSQLLQQGKIHYESKVLGRGIEEFSKALVGLLKGKNTGKAVLCVSDEEGSV